MDTAAIFTLTETEFVRQLRKGLYEEIPAIAVRDFYLCVHEISASYSPHKEYAIDALFMAHLEFQALKECGLLSKANAVLTQTVEKAHQYVIHKMEMCKQNPVFTFVPTKEEDVIIGSDLKWAWGKTALAELCNALRLGKCFGKASLSKIVGVIETAFNEKLDITYVRNRITNLKSRGKKSPTECLDRLLSYARGIEYNPSEDKYDETEEDCDEISA